MLKHAADHGASLSPSAVSLSPQFPRCLSLFLDNPYGPVMCVRTPLVRQHAPWLGWPLVKSPIL